MTAAARDIVRNHAKEKLARNEVVASMTVRLVRGVEIARIARTAGFDAFYIDVEHNSFSLDTAGQICLAALEAGMITPIMMIRGTIDGMIARRWGRIINITSSAVKAALPLLSLSNGARSGLTGFVSGLAREVAMHGVTINNLLPGRIDTERLASVIGKVGETQGLSYEEAARKAAAGNPTRRFGTAEEIGAYCAFLASRQAAYVTGQNLLVDGGEYPGL